MPSHTGGGKMLSLIFSVLALTAAQVHSLENDNTTSCKAVPGASNWPSPDVWARLNDTVEGHLLKPAAPGAVCHPTQPTYAAAQCAQVQKAWSDEFFHADNPVSVEWDNWTNDTCLPDPQLPCNPAGYPIYVINATTPEHVKAGVDFARKNNVRLIVKGSGHDYIGRSIAPNSLSIWLRHMTGHKLHEKFSPENCDAKIDGRAITARAGTQMGDLYTIADSVNHTIIGGNGRSVALGGFITGGGHSILAPHYGLAADNVLEIELVTPTGEIVTVNECHNTDLFWAMRGGGGSTFGIMTSVTMRMLPSPRVSNLEFRVVTAANNSQAFDMITYLVSKIPSLSDAGVSGYPIFFNTAYMSGMTGKVVAIDANATYLRSLFEPHFAHINATWPGMFYFSANTTEYPSVYAWYQDHYDPSPAGHESVVMSRLLDEQALTGNLTALRDTLWKISLGTSLSTVYMVSGKGVHNAQPRGSGNAVLPAWRKAYGHATSSIFYARHNESSRAEALRVTEFYGSALRELSPNMGAYMNEASRYEPSWQAAFWGDHYDRLKTIKRIVDPDDVLWCHPCVGNERWKEVEGQLCRIQE